MARTEEMTELQEVALQLEMLSDRVVDAKLSMKMVSLADKLDPSIGPAPELRPPSIASAVA